MILAAAVTSNLRGDSHRKVQTGEGEKGRKGVFNFSFE
jgi:hypothetical protein